MAGSRWDKEGESGLIDNFEFTITNAYFGTHEKYQNGEVLLLNWEGTTDSLDVPLMHVWYSFGNGWVSKDGGLTIEHESGNEEKFFNKSTQYYKIIERCRDTFKIAKQIEDRGGDPFLAASWVGLKFRMENEAQKGFNGAEGKDKQMPVEFLGFVDGVASNGGGAKHAAPVTETPQEKMARMKAEKAAAVASNGDGGSDPAPASLRDQVIAILKANDDFETAQRIALELPGIMDDDDLITELMDADGLFAQVRASA